MSKHVLTYLAFAVFAATLEIIAINYFDPNISDEQFAATLQKYNCKMTNEFVGKNAERLYDCNGVRYKYWTIYQWAKQDIKDGR